MAGNSNDGLTPFRVYRPNGDIVSYEGAERSAFDRKPVSPEQISARPAQQRVEQSGQRLLQRDKTISDEMLVSSAPMPSVQQFVAAPAARQRKGIPLGFMIFCGAAIALMSMGIRSILPLWQTPMLDDLGWTSLQFSIALATQNLLWGAFSPIFGAIADKFGSEKVLTFGALLQVAGLWLMSQVSDPTMFFLSGGVMIGIAQSAAGMGIVLGAIGRLVEPRHRTMAFGLITSASSAGMIVMTPIGRALLENNTWSEAFVMLSIISVPMILLTLFVRSNQDTGDLSTAAIAKLTIGEALGEALRHRGYVLLIFGFFVCGFHVTFIGVHLPKYLNDAGIGWQVAANALMIIGIFNVAACLAIGVIASTFSHKGALSLIYLLRAAVILAFVVAPLSEYSVYAFAAGMGVLWLTTVPLTQGIVAQVFGTQYMSMLFGGVFLSHQIGSFLGVYLGAEAVDRLGSYDLVWYVSVALGLLAAVCHIFIDEKPLARLRPEAAAVA